jgi:hypothetical protein
MGKKGKKPFKFVADVLIKRVQPLPGPGLQRYAQYGLPDIWTPDIRTLNFTPWESNKNTIPPCGRIFSLVLRFLARATTILAPARKKVVKTPSFWLTEGGQTSTCTFQPYILDSKLYQSVWEG